MYSTRVFKETRARDLILISIASAGGGQECLYLDSLIALTPMSVISNNATATLKAVEKVNGYTTFSPIIPTKKPKTAANAGTPEFFSFVSGMISCTNKYKIPPLAKIMR